MNLETSLLKQEIMVINTPTTARSSRLPKPAIILLYSRGSDSHSTVGVLSAQGGWRNIVFLFQFSTAYDINILRRADPTSWTSSILAFQP